MIAQSTGRCGPEKSKRWSYEDGLRASTLASGVSCSEAVHLGQDANGGNGKTGTAPSIKAYRTPILSFWDANRLFFAIEVSRLLR